MKNGFQRGFHSSVDLIQMLPALAGLELASSRKLSRASCLLNQENVVAKEVVGPVEAQGGSCSRRDSCPGAGETAFIPRKLLLVSPPADSLMSEESSSWVESQCEQSDQKLIIPQGINSSRLCISMFNHIFLKC